MRNPEFVRNLWSEFSLHRLIAMPIIVGIVFALELLVKDSIKVLGATSVAKWGFVIIVILWGTRLAAEAVPQEITARTWDGQRMSAIGPWPMTWGKLFGGTSYAWYGGLSCLVCFVIGAFVWLEPGDMLRTLGFAVEVGILAHAISLLVSLLLVQKTREIGRGQVTSAQIIGLAVALPIASSLAPGTRGAAEILWYGLVIPRADFILLFLGLFAAWTVLGVYRIMRIELQLENAPWTWLGFVLFCAIFAAGFGGNLDRRLAEAVFADEGGVREWWSGETAMAYGVLFAFLVAAVLTYVILIAEPKGRVGIKRLINNARARDWRAVTRRTPRLVLTLAVLVLLALWLALIAGGVLDQPSAERVLHRFEPSLIIAIMLFVLRDAGFVYLLNLRSASRRADLMALIYLAVVYAPLPLILRAVDLHVLLPLFWPSMGQGPVMAVVPVAVEVTLVFTLLYVSLAKLAAEGRAAAPPDIRGPA